VSLNGGQGVTSGNALAGRSRLSSPIKHINVHNTYVYLSDSAQHVASSNGQAVRALPAHVLEGFQRMATPPSSPSKPRVSRESASSPFTSQDLTSTPYNEQEPDASALDDRRPSGSTPSRTRNGYWDGTPPLRVLSIEEREEDYTPSKRTPPEGLFQSPSTDRLKLSPTGNRPSPENLPARLFECTTKDKKPAFKLESPTARLERSSPRTRPSKFAGRRQLQDLLGDAHDLLEEAMLANETFNDSKLNAIRDGIKGVKSFTQAGMVIMEMMQLDRQADSKQHISIAHLNTQPSLLAGLGGELFSFMAKFSKLEEETSSALYASPSKKSKQGN
jgi:hypothetical protein